MTYEEAVEEFGTTDGAALAEYVDWAESQQELDDHEDDEPYDEQPGYWESLRPDWF